MTDEELKEIFRNPPTGCMYPSKEIIDNNDISKYTMSNKIITVKDLKEFIKNLPDDLPIRCEGSHDFPIEVVSSGWNDESEDSKDWFFYDMLKIGF